jgi:hypothetical protein
MISLNIEEGILSEQEFLEISKRGGEEIRYNKVPYFAVELYYTDIKIVCLTTYDIFYSRYSYYFFTPSQYSVFKENGVDIVTFLSGIDIAAFAFLKIETRKLYKRFVADIIFYQTSISNDYRELELIEENDEMWYIGYLLQNFLKKIQVNIIHNLDDTNMKPACRPESFLYQILCTTKPIDDINIINELVSSDLATSELSELSSLLHTIRTTTYLDTTIGAYFTKHPLECKSAMEMLKEIPEVIDQLRKVLEFLQVRIIYPNPIRRIVAVLAHGCDIPYPIRKAYMLGDTTMLSSVIHGCVNMGYNQSILDGLFQLKDETSEVNVNDTMSQIKLMLTQYAKDIQKHNIQFYSPLLELHSKFSYLEDDALYRIHKPVGDRQYSFDKYRPELVGAEVPGIYVLYSDNVEESYDTLTKKPQPQQKFNILHPDCALFLRKYHDMISKKIVKNSVTLSDIISLFGGELYVIDTACRVTCEERSYTKPPQLQRIPSIDLGAKKRKRKTKKRLTKKRLTKRKHKASKRV